MKKQKGKEGYAVGKWQARESSSIPLRYLDITLGQKTDKTYCTIFFLAAPSAYGRSQTRDRTRTTAAIQAAVVTTLDPKPAAPQEHSCTFFKKKFNSCCHHHSERCFLNLNVHTNYLGTLLKHRFWFTKPGVAGWDSTFLKSITLSNERLEHWNYVLMKKALLCTWFYIWEENTVSEPKIQPN